MLIAHVSDSHSFLVPIPEEAEVVCHSGDLLPNLTRDFYGDRAKIETEQNYQRAWIRRNAKRLQNWIGSRKFIFSSGNHDYIDPTIIMREIGIDAKCIDLERYTYKGIVFYGFPFVPFMDGEWNLECEGDEMARHIRRLRDELQREPRIDVLLAHCPPNGILDCRIVVRNQGEITFVDQHEGNKQLTGLLSYIEEWSLPQVLLCGHLHPHYGVVEEFGLTVSNAATKANLLEVK